MSSDTDSQDEAGVFDRTQMKLFHEHFPIGKKLRYYPENHRQFFFRTIVIAYSINDQVLCAHDAIHLDDEGFPKSFRNDAGKEVPFEKWETFRLLLPDTTEMESKLDYFTRADLGRGGQFCKGNIITLVGDIVDKCVPMLETTVNGHRVMPEGPYADTPAILVTPDLDTLVLADRRKKPRVKCSVAANLHYANDSAVFACTLRDFSEPTLCLGINDANSSMPALNNKQVVTVEFSVDEEGMTYIIRGKVFRFGEDFCVVGIEQLYRDGKFAKITLMDIVEIKTALMNMES